jgi:hypothetical protein
MSLRVRLLLFAVALVTLPGLIFALVAFNGTRDALQQEVGIQLQQTAERVADVVASAVAKALADARAWASQEVMRDLVVGDLDKRVSRFLQIVTRNQGAYLDAVSLDAEGRVVAASSGAWMNERRSVAELADGAVSGPLYEPVLEQTVLEISVAIANPDAAGQSLGWLTLFYDWDAVAALVDETRSSLSALGKIIAVPIVGPDGKVIGGVSFGGENAANTALAYGAWPREVGAAAAALRLHQPIGDRESLDILAGTAKLSFTSGAGAVLIIERASEALAPIQAIRTRWAVAMASILLVGLSAAALLARQVGRAAVELTDDAIAALRAYPWPGNVRELRNVVERAVVLSSGDKIGGDFFLAMLGAPPAPGRRSDALDDAGDEHPPGLARRVERFERREILLALEETGDNKAEAARRLGISERNLWYKLKKHGL